MNPTPPPSLPRAPLSLEEAQEARAQRKAHRQRPLSWLQSRVDRYEATLVSLAPLFAEPGATSEAAREKEHNDNHETHGLDVAQWADSPLRVWLMQDSLARRGDPRRLWFGATTSPSPDARVALSGWTAQVQEQVLDWGRRRRDWILALALEQVSFLAAEVHPIQASEEPSNGTAPTFSPAVATRMERIVFLGQHSPRFAQGLLAGAARLQEEGQSSPPHFFALFQPQTGPLGPLWAAAMAPSLLRSERPNPETKTKTEAETQAETQAHPSRATPGAGHAVVVQQPNAFSATSLGGVPVNRAARRAWAAPDSDALLETQWWGQLALQQWGAPPAQRTLLAFAHRETLAHTPRQEKDWARRPGILRRVRPWQTGEESLSLRMTLTPDEPQNTAQTPPGGLTQWAIEHREQSREQWELDNEWVFALLSHAVEGQALSLLGPSDLLFGLDLMGSPKVSQSVFSALATWVETHAPQARLTDPWSWLYCCAQLMTRSGDHAPRVERALQLSAQFSSRPLHAQFPRRPYVRAGFNWVVAQHSFRFPGSRLGMKVPSLPLLALSLGREDYFELLKNHGGRGPSARCFWTYVSQLRTRLGPTPGSTPSSMHRLMKFSSDSLLPMLSLWQKSQLEAALRSSGKENPHTINDGEGHSGPSVNPTDPATPQTASHGSGRRTRRI